MAIFYFESNLIGFYEDYINSVPGAITTGWNPLTNYRWAYTNKDDASAQMVAAWAYVLDLLYHTFGSTSVTAGSPVQLFPSSGDIGTYNWDVSYEVWRVPLTWSWTDESGHHTNNPFSNTPTGDAYIGGVPDTYDFTLNSQNPGNHDDPYYLDFPYGESMGVVTFDTALPLEVPSLDRVFQLALQDTGKWAPKIGEPYPLKYKSGVNVVKVDFDTTRHAIIRTSRDGGFLVYEVDGDGNAIGLIRVFRYDRTLANVITPELLPVYLPRII
jgi:hypothetical protein